MVIEEEMKAKIQEYRNYLEQMKAMIEKFIEETNELLNDTKDANGEA